MKILDKAKNLIQSPFSSGTGLPFFYGEDTNRTYSGRDRPIEQSVLGVATRHGSLVKMTGHSTVDGFPNPNSTLGMFLKDAVYYALFHGNFAIADTSEGLRVYTNVKVGRQQRVVVLSDADTSLTVSRNRIAIFNYRKGGSYILDAYRRMETEYQNMCLNVNGSKGIVFVENAALGHNRSQTETEAEMQKLLDQLRENPINVLTLKNSDFKELNKYTDFQTYMDMIFRGYCRAYSVPSSLFGIDIPSHTNVSYASSLAQLKRSCLMPIMNSIKTGIDYLYNTDIEIDYSDITETDIGTGMRPADTPEPSDEDLT